MKHATTASFRAALALLPSSVRKLADKNFALLKENPNHPSLHFKKVGSELWSARIGISYRALALEKDKSYVWIWIGGHSEYDRLIE